MAYLLILVVYALAMILFGAYLSRRVRQSSDFFIAGRGLSAGLIFSTLLAANIGAGSTVGATGLGYRDGLSAWWWVGSAGIGSLILAFTVGPKIWRVAREQNLYTVGDYLEFRYDRRVRVVVAALLWLGSLAILAGQLVAIAKILNVVAGLNKPAGCMLGAFIITCYSAAGGLHSAARVNVIQLTVKLLGFAAAAFYLLPSTSFEQLTAAKTGSYASITGNGAPDVLRYLLPLAPAFVFSPGLLQKLFGARDEQAVRRGVAWNAFGLLAYAIVPVLLGMYVANRFPGLPDRELALPTLLTQALPFWLGSLLLGAVFSAELSAADVVLFMLNTSLSKDFYKSFLNPAADDQQLLRVARFTAIGCGALGGLTAIVLADVISALTIFYTLLSAALVLPLLAGLYTQRVTANAALAALLVSVIITFVLEQWTNKQGWHGVPSLLWGTAVGAVVMGVMTLAKNKQGALPT